MNVSTASFSAEQDQFREVLARFLASEAPPTEVRRIMASDTGHCPKLWQRLSGELALPGLHIPESLGGSGYGPVELGIAMEELGRALTPSAFLASAVMAATAILQFADEYQQQQLLPDIVAGRRTAALAIGDESGRWTGSTMSTVSNADGHYLKGTSHYVVDGISADDLIIAAIDPVSDQLGLFHVTSDAAGLSRTPLQSFDETRRLALVRCADTPARKLGADDAISAADMVGSLFDQVCAVFACEMVGGAQALLDAAVDYAKLRVQFGRTIGSFQAIKHKCADMLLEVESARSAAYVAIRCAADANVASEENLTACAAGAMSIASEAFFNTAVQCIQIHGGIGFTWENDTHLWFKRARASQQLLGDAAFHRERMLQAWEI
jgi:alkylation response protein AidB-like acyl-CoA dehydrogenase